MGKWVSLKRFGSRVHGTKVFFLDIYIYIYIYISYAKGL